MSATEVPKLRAMSSCVSEVSSIVSCSSAEMMESSSSPISAVMMAAAMQCDT